MAKDFTQKEWQDTITRLQGILAEAREMWDNSPARETVGTFDNMLISNLTASIDLDTMLDEAGVDSPDG